MQFCLTDFSKDRAVGCTPESLDCQSSSYSSGWQFCFRIQTHNMHNVPLLFIIVPGMLGAGVNWNLGLSIGTSNRYQIPSGYQDSDYSNFASLAKVGDEVASNFARLMAIKKRLEENENNDHIMRIFGMVSMISRFGLSNRFYPTNLSVITLCLCHWDPTNTRW